MDLNWFRMFIIYFFILIEDTKAVICYKFFFSITEQFHFFWLCFFGQFKYTGLSVLPFQALSHMQVLICHLTSPKEERLEGKLRWVGKHHQDMRAEQAPRALPGEGGDFSLLCCKAKESDLGWGLCSWMAGHFLSPPKDLVHKASVTILHTSQLGWKGPLRSSTPTLGQTPSWQLDRALSPTPACFLNTFVCLMSWAESWIWTVRVWCLAEHWGCQGGSVKRSTHCVLPELLGWLGCPGTASPELSQRAGCRLERKILILALSTWLLWGSCHPEHWIKPG